MIVFLHVIQISFEPLPDPAKIFKNFVGSTFSILFWALTARCSGLPADQMPPSQARCSWVPHVERGINIRDSRLDTAYLYIFFIIYTELRLSGCFHRLILSITAKKWVGYLKFPGRSYVLLSSWYVTVKQKKLNEQILRCCCRCWDEHLCCYPARRRCPTNFSELRAESRSKFEIWAICWSFYRWTRKLTC